MKQIQKFQLQRDWDHPIQALGCVTANTVFLTTHSLLNHPMLVSPECKTLDKPGTLSPTTGAKTKQHQPRRVAGTVSPCAQSCAVRLPGMASRLMLLS